MTHRKLPPLAAVLVVLGLGAAACSSSSEFDEPNDPLASEQYGIDQMQLSGAWDRSDGEGVVIVAAAGNDDAFPTAYNPDTPVIVVNASNEIGETARFSNFGDPRAVSAPGTRIMSTAPTYRTTIWPRGSEGYEELDGTSMASPQVAGIAALMVGRGGSPSDIRENLIQTAINPSNDPLLGAGIVQADAAVQESKRLATSLAVVLVLFVVGGLAIGVVTWERHRSA